MKKGKIIFRISIFVALFLLLLIASMYDLQISKSVCALKKGEYLSSVFILQISEIFGETVLYGLISVSALSIFLSDASAFTVNKYAKRIIKIFCLLILFAINVFCTYKIIGYTLEHFNFTNALNGFIVVICYILGGTFFSLIWFALMTRLEAKTLESMSKWALIVLLTAILSQILVQTIKPVFKRVRFRTMNYLDDFSLYSKWFSVNAISSDKLEYIKTLLTSDGYKSFPSGHTACASMMITLIALPDFCIKMQKIKIKILLCVIAVLYTALIGLSRIVIGAHFLSDVVVAIIITYFSFCIFRFLINAIFKKVDIDRRETAF